MPDPVALDEVNRYFSTNERGKRHPADADDTDSHSDSEEKKFTETESRFDDGDDEDTLHSMSAANASRATYHIPHTAFDANTGPKGVIADAQSYQRARKSSLRKTFRSFANGSYFSSESRSRTPDRSPSRAKSPALPSGSGETNEGQDEDDLMEKWRQNRLRELAQGSAQKQKQQINPRRRMWGFFQEVDALEYIDVVDKTPPETIVVVCIYDPEVCRRLVFLRQRTLHTGTKPKVTQKLLTPYPVR